MMFTIPEVFVDYPNPISVTIWCPCPGLYSGETDGDLEWITNFHDGYRAESERWQAGGRS